VPTAADPSAWDNIWVVGLLDQRSSGGPHPLGIPKDVRIVDVSSNVPSRVRLRPAIWICPARDSAVVACLTSTAQNRVVQIETLPAIARVEPWQRQPGRVGRQAVAVSHASAAALVLSSTTADNN
jgi:hypothetical protein